MSSASISKIHVTNSTGLSLNERFTAIAKPEPVQQRAPMRRRSRSRSRSMPRKLNASPVDRISSLANRRLLDQLARKHKMQAALKLKRRSMKTAGAAHVMRRGTVKALRVAPNGRPIRANTLTKVATMKADFIANANVTGRRPLRRSNSASNLAGRLGSRRPIVGGAAQRVAKRHLERSLSGRGAERRGRSRSRSRMQATAVRGRSVSRGRSASRGRANINNGMAQSNRGRSRSRSRARDTGAVSIKSRLGLRSGGAINAGKDEGSRRKHRGGIKSRRNSVSISGRGVVQGRVQKRRNSIAANSQRVGQSVQTSVGGRVARGRARSSTRNAGSATRSRSRTRKGSVGQQQQQQQQQRSGKALGRGGRRGRSQQRNSRGGSTGQKNGKARNGTTVRGRSRSRGGRGGRNLGKNTRPQVNKDALDQELDQYMATTKTENDMDYLLKN